MDRKAFFDSKIAKRIETGRNYRLNPGFYQNLFWRPCTVRILMVADGFLYFSDENFGLSDLIGILKNENLSYVRFDITVAHRGSPGAIRMGEDNDDISNSIASFRFDDSADFDPSDYDQVWLFGSSRSRLQADNTWSNKLDDSELRVLMEFMDAGGGVFATGDHEDLGAAMGGFLPRVRQMRRWFFPDPGPNGEGLAPPFEGPDRFDTNREGHDAGYQFNDQSDDIPQTITPKTYSVQVGPHIRATFPHPVLCGPKGRIRVLPDHAHESQCTTAADADASETLDGVNFTEFPAATDGGSRPLPEVIATSTVIGGHLTSGKSGVTNARTFGAISAYDGHRASKGRIVCDATWHHFININLTGVDDMAGNPIPGPKGMGFLATTAGQAVYEEIKAYFINIALWVSPKGKQKCMRNWGIFNVIWSERLTEVFDPAIRLESARLIDFIILGRHARDAIGTFASQCQATKWTWDFVLEEWPAKPFIDMGDPWRIDELEEVETVALRDIEPLDMVDLSWVGDAALGGAVLAMREQLFPVEQKTLDTFDDLSDDIARKGALTAASRAIDEAGRGLGAMFEAARSGFKSPVSQKR